MYFINFPREKQNMKGFPNLTTKPFYFAKHPLATQTLTLLGSQLWKNFCKPLAFVSLLSSELAICQKTFHCHGNLGFY